ncbi:helix-turn-helix domain-containing protein [Arthrobacter alpinus]|nr:helix-turn-helix domain-containing protein [Arthrobacter alpinus]
MQNNNRIVKRPAHAIDSVENALRLLVLLQERESVRIVDAAKDLGVAPSTAHRLMATLVYRGLRGRMTIGDTWQGPTCA